MDKKHRKWLLELTNLPTASGREQRVVRWIERYAARRPSVTLRADRYGNLTLSRRGERARAPIYFTAHMDHPAFVVEQVTDRRRLTAGFRGAVERRYFRGAAVLVHHGDGPPARGVVKSLRKDTDAANIVLDAPADAAPGDIVTWDVGATRVKGRLLHAPACDDLAGLAAAVSAFDALGADASVRLLLTRAEEYGFLGAIAACKARGIPRAARLICLENSKSFAESPIGGGPIVRVGDRTSTFDPDLTYRVGKVAEQLDADRRGFRWQRRLMPGGTCEASAFTSYGYHATCVCLPLGAYHNMDEQAGRIGPERISLDDYANLIQLLIACGRRLTADTPTLRSRLDDLFASRRWILD